MAMNLNDDIDEKKLSTIKLRVLEAETDNIVKKESKAAMIGIVDFRTILIS